MEQQWRFQQASLYWSLGMGAISMAGIWLQYFQKVIPIPSIVLVPLLMLLYLGSFVFVGWFLDVKLQLWKEGSEVSVERNPFNYDQPTYKEIQWGGRLARAAWLCWYRYFKEKGMNQEEFVNELRTFIEWQDRWAKTHGILNLCNMKEIYESKR